MRTYYCIFLLIFMNAFGDQYYIESSDEIICIEDELEDPHYTQLPLVDAETIESPNRPTVVINPPSTLETPQEPDKSSNLKYGCRVRRTQLPQRMPTINEIRAYFYGYDEKMILSQYGLYHLAPFRQYIQELPGFADFIIDLH